LERIVYGVRSEPHKATSSAKENDSHIGNDENGRWDGWRVVA